MPESHTPPDGLPTTGRGGAMTPERLAFITAQSAKFPSAMAQMALECALALGESERALAACEQELAAVRDQRDAFERMAGGMSADLDAFHRKVAAAIDPAHHLCLRDGDHGGQYADPIDAITALRTARDVAEQRLTDTETGMAAVWGIERGDAGGWSFRAPDDPRIYETLAHAVRAAKGWHEQQDHGVRAELLDQLSVSQQQVARIRETLVAARPIVGDTRDALRFGHTPLEAQCLVCDLEATLGHLDATLASLEPSAESAATPDGLRAPGADPT